MTAAADAKETAGLDRVWRNGPGLRGQLTAVNHGTIGMRFIVTGLVFFLVGGMLAMFIRLQLAWPGLQVLDPARYNQFVTMHGTTMMFLFAVPIMEGFAMYLIPKMLGARDLPFPRMSAFGYWCYLFGGIFLYSSFLFGAVPDSGWFMYVPLSSALFSPGMNTDFWLLGVTFAEIAAVTSAVELIVAILVTRAPGMGVQRMPLFAWYILIMAFMIALGFPPLILASILLEIERAFGFVYFEVARGGDPLLWQHLFWLFGHPEVYIVFLPAVGVVAMVVQTFSRAPIVGYSWVVMALVSVGFLSFGLWVHHMFTVGIPLLALSFFSAASVTVAIPTGVQIFAFIATLWSGRPWLRVPLLYVFGFFFVFVLGGLTGVMLALVPFDWQAHDTHFVVAHMHYVLIGGMMFPLFAGLHYWLPLASGRLPSETLSRTGFWLIFIGFNLTFLPMHLTGLLGLPRRVYTYNPQLGVEWLNLTSTAGGFLLAFGVVAALVDIGIAYRLGRRSQRNPWNADSLEWGLQWPVPMYNFASIPLVESRTPLWDRPELADESARMGGVLGGRDPEHRELLGTGILSAKPEQVIRISSSTWLPLLAALCIVVLLGFFIAKIYLLAALTLVPLVAVFMRWLWTTGDRHAPAVLDAGQGLHLPSQSACKSAPGWWALAGSLLIDASLFASLIFSYFYLWLGAPQWPPSGIGGSGLLWPLVSLALLLGGEVAMRVAVAAGRRDNGGRLRVFMQLAGVLAAGFLASHWLAIAKHIAAPQTDAYSSVVWTLAGFHAVHVLVAMLMAGFVWMRSLRGYVDSVRVLEPRIAAAFWRYMVVQGVIALLVIHLFPRTL